MAELLTQIEELEKLKDQVQVVGISIAYAVSDGTLFLNHDTNRIPFHQEMYIRDLNFEVEKLDSTEGIDSAQATTATLHQDWLNIKSVSVNVQKGLSNLFSSDRAQKEKLELQVRKAHEASEKYHKQGEPRKGDQQADLTQVCQI